MTLEQDRIREIWNSLTEDDRHRAGLLYESPGRGLHVNEESYAKALKGCMLAAGCWPGQSTFSMEDGAKEYEDILVARQLMDCP